MVRMIMPVPVQPCWQWQEPINNNQEKKYSFVFHGAEERGLLGSRWHASHPVVPKEQIVAVLNGDMIGRNSNDEAALLGGNTPHKNSDELVKWLKKLIMRGQNSDI